MAAMNRLGDDLVREECDVFVIGGGPAGSTVATLLADRGLDVVLAEKDRHPRFHIGESLLPMNLELFERLGLSDRIEAIAMHKPGAELNSPLHDDPVTLNFSEAWDKSYTYAYQVRRSEFDQILFENCVAKGARAMQSCRVTATTFSNDGSVLVTTDSRENGERHWQARYLVDASGRDTFLANQLSIKRRNRHHASAALYGHFTGCAPTTRRCRRQHQSVLVRARLVLVYSAAGWDNQCRCRLHSGIPASAQDRSGQFSSRDYCTLPGPVETTRSRPARHRCHRDRQFFVRVTTHDR